MQETARTVHQIYTPDGTPLGAVATENLWTGYENKQQFGFPTGNNDVTPLTSGKKYFEQLVKDIAAASDEIYIAGWQVNWDAVVGPNNVRLFDILLAAAKRKVKIYVMPWDDTPPVQTYDDQTKMVLELINEISGNKVVEVQLAAAHADKAASFYSHHQKQVVIDRKIAYIGGIDIAYGRYDDDHYHLKANTENRYGLNRYNGCIEWIGNADEALLVNPDYLSDVWDKNVRNPFSKKSKTNAQLAIEKIQAGKWQYHYETQGGGTMVGGKIGPSGEVNTETTKTLASASQPRMPWQDVHCKIEGPAVVDLTLNFVMRWNSTDPKTKLKIPELLECPIENKCLVQVLRSAPLAMRNLEYKKLDAKTKEKIKPPTVAQDDILQSMLTIIDKAQHFIYIENQFFVSEFGRLAGYVGASRELDPDSGPAGEVMKKGGSARAATRAMPGDSTALPSNDIVPALAKKLNEIILRSKNKQTPFHVYITLPVHSEGMLNDGAIMGQVHWTMQSLVFGTKSLLNSVRRSLHARDLYDKDKKSNWKIAYADGDKGYEDVAIERCFDYVTFLNLRNWAKLGTGKDERYVTEQIYIHSKLLIVDDRYAILGSANINDRSLLGGRDSELAVLVVDTDTKLRDLKQNGKEVPVRRFARDLRKQIWRKIFGITAGGSKAATELKDAVLHPAAPASWKAIQKRAAENTALYEAAFDWIPRNVDPNDPDGVVPASIWPRWDMKIEAKQKKAEDKGQSTKNLNPLARPMPFSADFWKEPQHTPEGVAGLSNIKGFITLLPIRWTETENNKIPYHNALLTHNEKTPSGLEPDTQMASTQEPDVVEVLV
jgi:phospholipase D1/2